MRVDAIFFTAPDGLSELCERARGVREVPQNHSTSVRAVSFDASARVAPGLTRGLERPLEQGIEAANKRLVEQEAARIEVLVKAAHVTTAL